MLALSSGGLNMAHLKITFLTGQDDLRGDSVLNFGVNLRNTGIVSFPNLVTGGVSGGGSTVREIDVNAFNDPNQLLNFTLEQISHEGTFETRDNWDMSNVQVIMTLGQFPIVLADGVSHRFDGGSPTINFINNRIL
jgi:hypothetical protein